MNSAKIQVDVWSDIACPWCYLGSRRFAQGLSAFQAAHPEVEVTIESHSYELSPDTPEDFVGNEIEFLSKHKGMPIERVEEMLGGMTELAAGEGVEFRFDRLQHVNTRRAHRLLHLAKDRGIQAQVMDRLFAAYFTEGRTLHDDDVLVDLAVSAGLDADEARAALSDPARGEQVDQDISRARMLGVQGVPFTLINQKYGVSGAQSPESFTSVLEQVLERDREEVA